MLNRELFLNSIEHGGKLQFYLNHQVSENDLFQASVNSSLRLITEKPNIFGQSEIASSSFSHTSLTSDATASGAAPIGPSTSSPTSNELIVEKRSYEDASDLDNKFKLLSVHPASSNSNLKFENLVSLDLIENGRKINEYMLLKSLDSTLPFNLSFPKSLPLPSSSNACCCGSGCSCDCSSVPSSCVSQFNVNSDSLLENDEKKMDLEKDGWVVVDESFISNYAESSSSDPSSSLTSATVVSEISSSMYDSSGQQNSSEINQATSCCQLRSQLLEASGDPMSPIDTLPSLSSSHFTESKNISATILPVLVSTEIPSQNIRVSITEDLEKLKLENKSDSKVKENAIIDQLIPKDRMTATEPIFPFVNVKSSSAENVTASLNDSFSPMTSVFSVSPNEITPAPISTLHSSPLLNPLLSSSSCAGDSCSNRTSKLMLSGENAKRQHSDTSLPQEKGFLKNCSII